MEKVIFSELCTKGKEKLHHKSHELYFWESPVESQVHGDSAIHHNRVRTSLMVLEGPFQHKIFRFPDPEGHAWMWDCKNLQMLCPGSL